MHSFTAEYINGVIKTNDQRAFIHALESFKGLFVVEIKRFMRKRSDRQNRYWRGVVIKMVAEEMGERNHDHVAEYLKNLDEAGAIMRQYYEVGGRRSYRIKSTTELSTVEWEELMKIYREWASQFLKLFIPEPDERFIRDHQHATL